MNADRRVVEIDDAQLRIKGNMDALEQAVLAAGHAMPFCERPRYSDGQCRSVDQRRSASQRPEHELLLGALLQTP